MVRSERSKNLSSFCAFNFISREDPCAWIIFVITFIIFHCILKDWINAFPGPSSRSKLKSYQERHTLSVLPFLPEWNALFTVWGKSFDNYKIILQGYNVFGIPFMTTSMWHSLAHLSTFIDVISYYCIILWSYFQL